MKSSTKIVTAELKDQLLSEVVYPELLSFFNNDPRVKSALEKNDLATIRNELEIFNNRYEGEPWIFQGCVFHIQIKISITYPSTHEVSFEISEFCDIDTYARTKYSEVRELRANKLLFKSLFFATLIVAGVALNETFWIGILIGTIILVMTFVSIIAYRRPGSNFFTRFIQDKFSPSKF